MKRLFNIEVLCACIFQLHFNFNATLKVSKYHEIDDLPLQLIFSHLGKIESPK